MSRKQVTVEGYSSTQIKDLIDSNRDYKVGIKLYTVYQVSLGKSCNSLSDVFHMSSKQLTNWVHRFNKSGVEGLHDQPGRGRTSELQESDKKRLIRLLEEESPLDYGWNTQTWNGPLLRVWIKDHLGIEYSRSHIYNILKSLGFSYQKSKGFYPEADEQKQELFKESLKKTARKST